jgi:hypothetical protein
MERAVRTAVLTAGEDVSFARDAPTSAAQRTLRRARAAVAKPPLDDGWAGVPLLPNASHAPDAPLEGDLDPWGDQGRGLLVNAAAAEPSHGAGCGEMQDDRRGW